MCITGIYLSSPFQLTCPFPDKCGNACSLSEKLLEMQTGICQKQSHCIIWYSECYFFLVSEQMQCLRRTLMRTQKTCHKVEKVIFTSTKLLSGNIKVRKAQTGLVVAEELLHIWYSCVETSLKFLSNGKIWIFKTLFKTKADTMLFSDSCYYRRQKTCN